MKKLVILALSLTLLAALAAVVNGCGHDGGHAPGITIMGAS